MNKRAVFLDRDGVIVEQEEYLNQAEDLVLIPGAGEAIARLNAASILVIVVTNQAGIAKGHLTLSDLKEIHARLRHELSACKAYLDAIYYCPHHPEATVPEFLRDCSYRKPGVGMFEKARDEHGIDLEASYLVGDATGDILAGKRAGCRTILVATGFGGSDERYVIEPDLRVADLPEAVERILSEVGR